MSLPAILDVAIGLSFIYALLALVCSGINEWIAGLANLRARKLEQAIVSLLGSDSAKDYFYSNPLIKPLEKHRLLNWGNKKPSYIGAELFAGAVLNNGSPAVGSTAGCRLRSSCSHNERPEGAEASRTTSAAGTYGRID
jgi:hypothetical protein